jgi:DNA-binding LacI/PurR family transcriptional regulator
VNDAKPPKGDGAGKSRRRMQMADLAKLAGVAPSTVSRALADSELVSLETRERIQTLARQFNYTINRAATRLRSGINRTIGVVVPYEQASRQSFADPFLHGMIGSLADALTQRDYEMLLVRIDAEKLDAASALIDAGRAAGVILIGQWRHHDQLNAMAERGLPLVVWGAQLPGQRYCTVGSDNRRGGQLAAQHLLAEGRRRIGFLGDVGLPEVAERYRGFAEVLKAHQVALPDRRHASAPFLAGAGRMAMQALLEVEPELDAVFASGDLLAMAAIGALRESGRRVPEDVAVVGYDDVELAAHFSPHLTTVRQPIHEGGTTLVEALLQMIEHGEVMPSIQLETQLIVRQSSHRGEIA